MYQIYKIVNSMNDKVYVGRTSRNIAKRWKEHLKSFASGDTRQLYCAMRKYGVDKFHIELLENCNSLDDMIAKEAYYCDMYEAYTQGYNMTTGGEVNPMECEKSRISHDDKMRSESVRASISISMKAARQNSSKKINVHKGRETRRISEDDLATYIAQGYSKGVATGKVRMYNKETLVETTIWPELVNEYIAQGWLLGGKPNRISPEHAAKLAASHKTVSEDFRKEQSLRLKKFYLENPNRDTRSKKPVIISNPETGEVLTFDSCLALCRAMKAPDSIAKAGTVKRWVDVGFITRKNSIYHGWKIDYESHEKNKEVM